MTKQHIVTGHYVIEFYNKYGAKLTDLTLPAKNLESAKEIGNRRIHHADDISQADSHHLPTAFTVDRRIYNSEDNQ